MSGSQRGIGGGAVAIMLIVIAVVAGGAGYYIGSGGGPTQTVTVTAGVESTVVHRLERLVSEFVAASELPLLAPAIMTPSVLSEPDMNVLKDILLREVKLPRPPFSGPIPPDRFEAIGWEEFGMRFGKELGLPSAEIERALGGFRSHVRSELDDVVNPGDFVVKIEWLSKGGLSFSSLAIVDGTSLDPEYDSFMRFVPIRRVACMSSLYASNSSDERYHERDRVALTGPVITIFPGKPWIYAAATVEAHLGILAASTPVERRFTLSIFFDTRLEGGAFAYFFGWFFRPGVALGSPHNGTNIGASIFGEVLSSKLWLEGSGVFYGDNFTYEVLDRMQPAEIGPILVKVIGVSYVPPNYYEYTSIKVQPRDPDLIEILNDVRPERGLFAWEGSRFSLEGTIRTSGTGSLHLEADLILTTDWDWLTIGAARIYVWDEI